MTYTLKVQKNTEIPFLTDENLFVQQFNSKQEVQAVLNLCNSVRRIDWLESLIIPVRTDNLKNFCKDFFLPSFFNVAIKTNNFALNIWGYLIFAFCDLITCPFRILTVIPRYLYNKYHPKETHLFYKYLINKGLHADDLNKGCVHIRLEKGNEDNRYKFETELDLTKPYCTVNFIGLPKNFDFCRDEVKLEKVITDLKLKTQTQFNIIKEQVREMEQGLENGEELTDENRNLFAALKIHTVDLDRALGLL